MLNVATYSRVLFANAGLLSILIGAPVIQDRPGTGQTPSAGKDFSLPPWVKSHDLSIDPLAHGKRSSGKPPDRSRRCARRCHFLKMAPAQERFEKAGRIEGVQIEIAQYAAIGANIEATFNLFPGSHSASASGCVPLPPSDGSAPQLPPEPLKPPAKASLQKQMSGPKR
jgi:hypothetical protein